MAFRWPWNRLSEEEQRAAQSGLAFPDSWLGDAFGHISTPSGKRVTPEKALGIGPVWAAVRIISEQIGQLPLKVYKEIDEDGNRVEASNHRSWTMLHDRPNSHTPAGRFWATTTVHLLLYGNAFILKRRDALGVVQELQLLMPQWMTVYWNPDTGDKQFIYQPQTGNRVEYKGAAADDILHVFGLSTDGIIGKSVISTCASAFGTALAREDFEGGFYNRGATFAGVLQAQRTMSEPAVKRLGASFKALYGGVDNSHGIPVLEEGVEFKPISNPLRDLQFVESQQLSRTDIAVMFTLPPNYLGGSSGDGLTYSTVESNQTAFALHAIAPWTHTISEAISQDASILPQNIFCAEFDLNAMLRGAPNERAQFYKLLSDMRAITRNEIRRNENLPPVPGGDEFDIPTQERITVSEDATVAPPGPNTLPGAPAPPQIAPPQQQPGLKAVPPPTRQVSSNGS